MEIEDNISLHLNLCKIYIKFVQIKIISHWLKIEFVEDIENFFQFANFDLYFYYFLQNISIIIWIKKIIKTASNHKFIFFAQVN